jgi:serine/threonine protein kinase
MRHLIPVIDGAAQERDAAVAATEPTIEFRVGAEIAGYRVIELVGSGGMGRVYRALHIALDRIVALKVIRPEIASDDSFRQRFRREARLIASIDHPSVVPVYDADETGGVPFIAMRWMRGSDLRHALASEGPMEPARAVQVLSDIASAVDAAHRIGLVHRDIKPANVLLEGERAFLSDFGLARLLAGPEAATITGGFVGTVDYAAPELLEGTPWTARADIYALGCVLYEMLTGSVPYPIDSMLAKLRAHTHDERPVPSARRPDLPRGLDQVVIRALAIEPSARFATASELSIAARRALHTPPARRPTSGRSPRRRGRLLALAGALLAGAAVALGLILTLLSPTTDGDSSKGRPLPTAASLEKCANDLTGPPRTCFTTNGGGGVLEVGDEGQTVRMSTMNLDVTGIGLASELPIPWTGGDVSAPPGSHFVLVDLTITNVTHTEQEFEASETLSGRRTALWLTGSHGKTLPWHGPRGADYSMQDVTAATATGGLYQAELPPGQPIRGQLAFYYPNAELREAKLAVLEVKELGEPFNVYRSQALIRLHP